MRTEVIFKRDTGNRVKVEVSIRHSNRSVLCYDIRVFICKKGKRTWIPIINTSCSKYRDTAFGSPEREAYALNLNLEVITRVEMEQAKTALWELMHPSKHEEKSTVY